MEEMQSEEERAFLRKEEVCWSWHEAELPHAFVSVSVQAITVLRRPFLCAQNSARATCLHLVSKGVSGSGFRYMSFTVTTFSSVSSEPKSGLQSHLGHSACPRGPSGCSRPGNASREVTSPNI